MKDIVLEECIKWKKGEIQAAEAMDNITQAIFPREFTNATYLRKLVAFIYDLDPDKLLGESRKSEVMIPKILYRTLLFERYDSYTTVASKAGLDSHATVMNSVKRHNEMLETNVAYKRIYDSINTLLTEVF